MNDAWNRHTARDEAVLARWSRRILYQESKAYCHPLTPFDEADILSSYEWKDRMPEIVLRREAREERLACDHRFAVAFSLDLGVYDECLYCTQRSAR